MTLATVTINPKGQITIPAPIREHFNLRSGDELALLVQDDHLIIERKYMHIEAAFGFCKANVSVSLEEMEQAIRTRAQHDDRD